MLFYLILYIFVPNLYLISIGLEMAILNEMQTIKYNDWYYSTSYKFFVYAACGMWPVLYLYGWYKIFYSEMLFFMVTVIKYEILIALLAVILFVVVKLLITYIRVIVKYLVVLPIMYSWAALTFIWRSMCKATKLCRKVKVKTA